MNPGLAAAGPGHVPSPETEVPHATNARACGACRSRSHTCHRPSSGEPPCCASTDISSDPDRAKVACHAARKLHAAAGTGCVRIFGYVTRLRLAT